ncbi:MAG: type II toxin-antitoxin system antitoxin SocA domain-containing protein [Acidobacteriota bacterium]
MTYPASAIANYFVQRGLQDRSPVDPMKLQKLIYFAHGWNLAIYNEPLIDEMIEAWPYGPVTRSIYHAVKSHGSGPIEFPIFDQSADGPSLSSVSDDDTKELLERVWRVYGEIASVELSKMSHDPEGPWHSAWHERALSGRIKGVDILNEEIRDYFIKVADQQPASDGP